MMRYSLAQLASRAYDLVAPFEIDLGENRHLSVEAVLRILPGKRMVARASAGGKIALVKIFFQSRNFNHETDRYKLLHNSGIKTPLLLSQQPLPEGGICHYEFIDGAQSFSDRWKTADDTLKAKLLEKLLLVQEQYYRSGLCQSDLHLDNFIFSGETLYALDPAGCEKLGASDAITNNLALLLAQFSFAEQPVVAAAIGAKFTDIDKNTLVTRSHAEQKIRRQNFLQKIYRECTYIHTWKITKKRSQHLAIFCIREQCSPGMRKLLENIDTIPESAEILKHGNSSVVSCRSVDGKKIVVKNSRNKDIWRLLRRCLRRSRASNAWYFAHLLQDAGIHVPAPLALVERKLGPLVLESWFVSACIEGDNLLDVWLYQQASPQELLEIRRLFSAMEQLQISHGDMKATNLLVCDEKIFVIDYDGATEHKSPEKAHQAIKKDRERFLANWSGTRAAAIREALSL
jgi:tRNA A-37 threonylcarbamoyl transferase component Bud32